MLRNKAMEAMIKRMSTHQKANYMKGKTYHARLTWLVKYMLDPDKMTRCGLEGSKLLAGIHAAKKRLKRVDAALEKAKMRKTEILEDIRGAGLENAGIDCEKFKRLSTVDAHLAMAKMRRTQSCEEIGMKRNEVTLLDAQFDNAGIDCETEMRAIDCEKESIGRMFESMLRRIEEP